MSSFFIVILKLLAIPLYPVGLVLTLSAAGLILGILNRKRLSFFLFSLAFSALLLFSLPGVSLTMIHSLEKQYDQKLSYPKTIAILMEGGAALPASLPRKVPETNEAGDRILYTARIFKQGCADYIITSGSCVTCLKKTEVPSSWDDAELLINACGIDSSRIIKEDQARTTREHGVYLDKIFKEKGWKKEIILVTSAAHMPRSVAVFKKYGFTVIPAPTDFFAETAGLRSLQDYFPKADAIEIATIAFHEWYGLIGYKLLGWI